MASSDPVLSCAEAVRASDYDRYLSVLFAYAGARPALFALYAFNYEVAKTAEIVSEPTLGQIRLQWWREAIDEIFEGRPRQHEVVLALSAAVQNLELPRFLFDALIDAREQDLLPTPFATQPEFEAYADATSGHLMRLAARSVGAGDALDAQARSFGIAYALTGLLRAFPHHAAQRRLMLPVSALTAAGIAEEDFYAGRAENIRVLINEMTAQVEGHLRAAAGKKIPRGFLPALLPAALIRPYLKLLGRAGFEPYRDPVALSVPRKQLAMVGALLRRRI